MAIEATYVLIDYIKAVVNQMIAPDSLAVYPGRWAAGSSDLTAATYTLEQNVNFDIQMWSTDALTMIIYHTDFEVMQNIISRLLLILNPQNVRDENVELYAIGMAEGVKYLELITRVRSQDNNAFIEGTEYYYVSIDILLSYVKLFSPKTDSVAVYISGV